MVDLDQADQVLDQQRARGEPVVERRRRQAEDREVEVAGADVVEHPVAAAAPQRHLDAGMVGVEFAQQHRHVEGRGRALHHPHRDLAADHPAQRVGLGDDEVDVGEDAVGVLEQPRSLVGQPDHPRGAFEEADAELLLELADLPAEGGLDDEFLRRGGAEAAGAGDRAEVTQLTELHVTYLSSS